MSAHKLKLTCKEPASTFLVVRSFVRVLASQEGSGPFISALVQFVDEFINLFGQCVHQFVSDVNRPSLTRKGLANGGNITRKSMLELGNLHRERWACVSTGGRKHNKTHNALLIFYPQLLEQNKV